MNSNDAIAIQGFVEKRFGVDVLTNLNNIHQGGLNNSKGRDYENYFQLYRAFELASQDIDHSQHILTCQELAFIDDICHWDLENSIKHNYQAKNSSGVAADWTSEITARCERQTIIDIELHKVNESRNYLLVSCANKAQNNLVKIPSTLKTLNTCTFFPYYKTLLEMIQNTNLKGFIESLTCTDSPSQLDFAASLILGFLNDGETRTIKALFERACCEGNPNPFIKFREKIDGKIPDWVKEIVTASSSEVKFGLECDRVYLELASGLRLTVKLDNILCIPESKIQEINNIRDLANLFLWVTSQELDSQDSSPVGGVNGYA